jgi:hypothetical protein
VGCCSGLAGCRRDVEEEGGGVVGGVVGCGLLGVKGQPVGITYGGAGLSASPRSGGGLAAFIDLSEPAPAELEGHADATWGDRNVFGLMLICAGAAVVHQTKKISLIVESPRPVG